MALHIQLLEGSRWCLWLFCDFQALSHMPAFFQTDAPWPLSGHLLEEHLGQVAWQGQPPAVPTVQSQQIHHIDGKKVQVILHPSYSESKKDQKGPCVNRTLLHTVAIQVLSVGAVLVGVNSAACNWPGRMIPFAAHMYIYIFFYIIKDSTCLSHLFNEVFRSERWKKHFVWKN